MPDLPPWYAPLCEFASFLPISPDKSPACKSYAATASTDANTVSGWRRWCPAVAAYIAKDSRLIVVDLDSPTKRPDAPNGPYEWGKVVVELGVELPTCPTVQTPSGGTHLYFRAPKGIRIEKCIALWPGVDILARGSLAILPGSRIIGGTYELMAGDFEDIPEMPRALAVAIRNEQRKRKRSGKRKDIKAARATMPVPINDAPACLSPQERYRLFRPGRNRHFIELWNREKTACDTSMSAYEYHMAKACFCIGLNTEQTVEVIRWWWRHIGETNRSGRKLRDAIFWYSG